MEILPWEHQDFLEQSAQKWPDFNIYIYTHPAEVLGSQASGLHQVQRNRRGSVANIYTPTSPISDAVIAVCFAGESESESCEFPFEDMNIKYECAYIPIYIYNMVLLTPVSLRPPTKSYTNFPPFGKKNIYYL